MENKQKHLDQLSDIKDLMERSSRFISLSGLSGIVAGIVAIVGGLAAFYRFTGSFGIEDYALRLSPENAIDMLFFLLLDAALVLLIAISASIFFTTRKAKKQGLPLWDKMTYRVLLNLFIPLAIGGAFCLILIYHALTGPVINFTLFALVAPVTLIFYGLALFNAGKYTFDEVRWLGVSEILLGLLGCIFLGFGLLFWIIGFGVLHIIYGGMMWWKYERNTPTNNQG